MHGILASATDWILNTPGWLSPDGNYIEDRYLIPTAYRKLNQRKVPIGGSTAFVLSQFGFDVWLGNCRGTAYSRGHLRFNSAAGIFIYAQMNSLNIFFTDTGYWKFAIDHVALFDIPTMINHVLRATRSGMCV